MKKTDYIQLKHFSNEDLEVLKTFKLPEEQGQFTSLPIHFQEVIEGQHRIVIVDDAEPVGFFLLHVTERVKDYSDNRKAMLLTSLSINHLKQGKGYAKQAMTLVKEFVVSEFPHYNEIVLAVNHKNTAAQKLYIKVGFQDTGRRKMGPIGEQFIMSLML
ncbi:GNAT family N-acetyltransferase [Alkalihalobacillus sp. 1P02AB]|uniref:GNAT family N-acetyltransferase n=1 Tax=Alkalihalobacillus sp. 1P02AB TaxID=3132260 RepID=UPI0039A440D6